MHSHLSHDVEASHCLHYTRFISVYIFMWFCTKDRNTRHDKPKATLIFTQHKGGGELELFAVTVRICTKIKAETKCNNNMLQQKDVYIVVACRYTIEIQVECETCRGRMFEGDFWGDTYERGAWSGDHSYECRRSLVPAQRFLHRCYGPMRVKLVAGGTIVFFDSLYGWSVGCNYSRRMTEPRALHVTLVATSQKSRRRRNQGILGVPRMSFHCSWTRLMGCNTD